MNFMVILVASVMLTAALTLATLSYTGSAMTSGNLQAAAVTVVSQAQQIATATENYARAHNFAMPASVAILVQAGFLGAEPRPPMEFSDSAWQIAVGDIRLASLSADAGDICSRIHQRASGGRVTSSSASPKDGLPFYCDGEDGRARFVYRL